MRARITILLLTLCLSGMAIDAPRRHQIKLSVDGTREAYSAILQCHQYQLLIVRDGKGTHPVSFPRLPASDCLIRVLLQSGGVLTTTVHLGHATLSQKRVVEVRLDARRATRSRKQLEEAHVVPLSELEISEEALRHYQRSFESLEGGDWQAAEKKLQQAVRIAPKFVEAWGNLGLTQQRMGKFPEAEQSFRNALDLRPDSFAANINMAAVLGILDRMDDAAVCAARAYRLRPLDVLANLQMGSIAFEQQRYRDAVPYLQFVAQHDPLSFANPQLLLMRAYQEMEEPVPALMQARRWLEIHLDGELRPMVMKEYVRLKALAAQQLRHEQPS